ncbi:hypothetical protein AB4876_10940 [Zhongshania guokunii]|uniref:Toxin co-regulated pilus biosynthesis protein Q C-terminal domain-containing protein n=1 Tax=Zhongshania guokunii TaxID=641783 RepID=A0ABV3U6T2_9GAMM
MLTLKNCFIAAFDLICIGLALGGLLFACSNQEAGRQQLDREVAIIEGVVLQPPLNTLVNLDESLWRITEGGLTVRVDPELGILVDVRYWSHNAESMIANFKNAGYKLDYINTGNQRLTLWVNTQEQLKKLAGMQGVSAVSVSTAAPKRDLTLRAFDERKN